MKEKIRNLIERSFTTIGILGSTFFGPFVLWGLYDLLFVWYPAFSKGQSYAPSEMSMWMYLIAPIILVSGFWAMLTESK